MKIGFTGHRDKMVYEHTLNHIASKYPGATWVHGGAKGFDSQVENYAKRCVIFTRLGYRACWIRRGWNGQICRNSC